MTDMITVTEAYEMVRNGDAILIDVREPDEFKTEHIAYALSIPLGIFDDGFMNLDIPETKTILFQCHKGSRGQMACERAQGLGSRKNPVLNVEGGIEVWKSNGFPVIGGSKTLPKLSIFRQVQIIVGLLVALSVVIGFAGLTLGFAIAGILGTALFFAGLSGWCGLAMILSKMPWNK